MKGCVTTQSQQFALQIPYRSILQRLNSSRRGGALLKASSSIGLTISTMLPRYRCQASWCEDVRFRGSKCLCALSKRDRDLHKIPGLLVQSRDLIVAWSRATLSDFSTPLEVNSRLPIRDHYISFAYPAGPWEQSVSAYHESTLAEATDLMNVRIYWTSNNTRVYDQSCLFHKLQIISSVFLDPFNCIQSLFSSFPSPPPSPSPSFWVCSWSKRLEVFI